MSEHSQDPQPGVRRRGRPRGRSSGATRASILKAATEEFNHSGYEATSLRSIARRAKVDPALIHHYFQDKTELFLEVVHLPLNPGAAFAEALQGPEENYGENLVRTALRLWGSPTIRPAATALFRSVLSSKAALNLIRPFLQREILRRISEPLQGPDADYRAAMAASQLVGMIMARYIIELEPVVAATDEQIVASIAPVLQWHLTGRLPAQ
ncbi:TetR family transcriptional regulator [Glutamicibacter sp. MNS18]|uniref:TetR/AcrR family transcriptional regulator n=1 Tax=Glutamicibacter sp. MNS18 TaxID=2989817 RepID=UPI00223652DF|nr:TetR family transcriptional regulator [Glutamicibacter sp. MNS18]MCW4466012.1 TetR family transcriptional regulator [Glutamicibacter sp. MNS18]